MARNKYCELVPIRTKFIIKNDGLEKIQQRITEKFPELGIQLTKGLHRKSGKMRYYAFSIYKRKRKIPKDLRAFVTKHGVK